jgi:transposase
VELEKELEQFRQEAQRLKAGRRSGSLPFTQTLRAFAVRYAEHTVAAGGAGGPRPKPVERSAALVPVRLYLREGLVVEAQTLWDQLDALAGHLQKSFEALLSG